MNGLVVISKIYEVRGFICDCGSDVFGITVFNDPAPGVVDIEGRAGNIKEPDKALDHKEVTADFSVEGDIRRAVEEYLREYGYTKINYIEEYLCVEVFMLVDNEEQYFFIDYTGVPGEKCVCYDTDEDVRGWIDIDVTNRNELLNHALILARHYADRRYCGIEQ